MIDMQQRLAYQHFILSGLGFDDGATLASFME
jgi:hypothetical protein